MTDDDRVARLARAVADRVTDEILTTPADQLTPADTATLLAAFAGPHADEIAGRIDRLNRERGTDGTTDGVAVAARPGEGRSAVAAPPVDDATRGSPRRDTSNGIPPTQGATVTDERSKMRQAAQQQQGQQAATTGTATSRARSVRTAVRKPTKARLALSGPSGSGKTWTALSVAQVIAPGGRIVVIDTEPSDDLNSAAELYADAFAFDVIDWRRPPFDPRDLALTVTDLGASGEVDVLIVDSASPFWRGSGGTLDVADGRFGGWKEATPAQDAMIAAILNSPMHVIFCTRAKQTYEVSQGNDGKQTVQKLGLAPIQRDDVEYEFQVVVMIDTAHRLDIGKTRCQPLAGLSFPANMQGEFATIYRDWLDKGLRLIRTIDADLIVAAYSVLPEADRPAAKRAFGAALGRPDHLEETDLPAAWAWLSANLSVDPHPFTVAAKGDEATCGVCGLGRRAGWHAGDTVRAPLPTPPEPAAAPPGSTVSAATADDGPSDRNGDTAQHGGADVVQAHGRGDGSVVVYAGDGEDTGHCATCGAPIWYSVEEWLHVDPDDDEAGGEHDAIPADPGADVDSLFAATRPTSTPDLAEFDGADTGRITAEVALLTPTKIVQELEAAGLPITGTPKVCRARLLEFKLSAAAVDSTP